MASRQTLSEGERRIVAGWAADCAESVLPIFQAAAPDDDRPMDAVARARGFARGELDTAGQIRRRFAAGGAARDVTSAAASAAAKSATQAAAVAHMGAHALGAAAYAARAARLAAPDDPRAGDREIARQLAHMTHDVRRALRQLPRLGEDPAGPLGPGLLARGDLGATIRRLQAELADEEEL
jgi:hypothetical protein